MLEPDCGCDHASRQQETPLAKLALVMKESELPDGQVFLLNPVGHFIRSIVVGAWRGAAGCVLAFSRPW